MFYDNFVKLCSEKGVTRTRACTDCGVSRTAWHKWENGAVPNGSTLNKFAEYFRTNIDVLIGNIEKEKAPTNDGERMVSDAELKFALWGDCGEISDEDLADVRRYAAFVRERKKDNKK